MSLRIASTFARYRIDASLGVGGMASVFKAWEEGLDRHVALKVLPSELAQDKTFGQRFNREAKMVARLEHPNIVPIFAYGIEAGLPWMAMRLVSGGNLVSFAGGRPVPPQRAAEIIEGIASALDYAHARGVIHRDVKPANILLDEDGRVYLVDFGIARMAEGTQRLTQAGIVAGTPTYMAPEQATAGELDARVDIYALGIVAYELLTGAPPFRATEPMDVLIKHVSDPVPIPARGSVPEGAIESVLKALAKKPDDRWSTATEFAEALLHGLGGAQGERSSSDDYVPTMGMERPDFSTMPAPKVPTYDATVLAQSPVAPKARTYDPTVLAQSPVEPRARTYAPTVLAQSPVASQARTYDPTVLAQVPPAVRKAGPPETRNNTNLKIAAAVLSGLGLLLIVFVFLAYSWWGQQRGLTAGIDPAPAPVIASGAQASLPKAPEAQPTEDTSAQAPAEKPAAAPDPAQPDPPQPAEPPAQAPPAGKVKATRGDPAKTELPATARPAKVAPRPEPAAKPTAEADEHGAPPDLAAMAAVPEASRTWATASQVDRTVPLQLDRSVDLGVRVSGVPVDRVYLTTRDARAGIKKFFKKNTDKLRFTAEFLLNCPKGSSRPRLHFEVELQSAAGGVLDRVTESKNCEGHVRLSRDVAVSNLDAARKVRVLVRSGG